MTIIYTVQVGDTWQSIAMQYGVSMQALRSLNANRKGRSERSPGYQSADTFLETGFMLLPGLTVRIPEKNKTNIKKMSFKREEQYNKNKNPFHVVKTTAFKPVFDIHMTYLTNPKVKSNGNYYPAPIEKPSTWQATKDDVLASAITTATLVVMSQTNVGRTAMLNKMENDAKIGLKKVGNITQNVANKTIDNYSANPARFTLLNSSVALPYVALLITNPKLASKVEGEFPVLTSINFEGSGFNAGAGGSLNLWNGQKYVGGGGGLSGSISKKELDVMPSGGVSLTMIPQKYLKDKKGNMSRAIIAEKTDDVLEGASVGGSVAFRNIMLGAEYNYGQNGEAGKLVYKVGLSKKVVGVDASVGTSASVKVGDPMWQPSKKSNDVK